MVAPTSHMTENKTISIFIQPGTDVFFQIKCFSTTKIVHCQLSIEKSGAESFRPLPQIYWFLIITPKAVCRNSVLRF